MSESRVPELTDDERLNPISNAIRLLELANLRTKPGRTEELVARACLVLERRYPRK